MPDAQSRTTRAVGICGPMMTEVDDSWRSVGATAFGTRLLTELALDFRTPTA